MFQSYSWSVTFQDSKFQFQGPKMDPEIFDKIVQQNIAVHVFLRSY